MLLWLNSIVCFTKVIIYTQRQMERPKFVRMYVCAESQKTGLSKHGRVARRVRGGSPGFS